MRLCDAREAVARRSQAVAGVEEGPEPRLTVIEGATPDEVVRRILFGLVPDDDIDQAVEGVGNATMNALLLLARAGSIESQFASLQAFLAQELALGIMIGRPRA